MPPPEPESDFSGSPSGNPGWWSSPTIFLTFSLFLLPIIITFHGLIHLPYLALAYLVFNLWVYLRITYLSCTRCPRYGGTCPLFGGKAAPLLWPRAEEDGEMPDRPSVRFFWIIFTLVPAALLLLTERFIHLGGVLAALFAFHLGLRQMECGRGDSRKDRPCSPGGKEKHC